MKVKKINIRDFIFLIFLFSAVPLQSQNSIKQLELETQKTIRKVILKNKNLTEENSELKSSLGLLSKTTTELYKKLKHADSLKFETDSLLFQSLENSQKTLENLLTHWESNSKSKIVIDLIQKDYFLKTSASPLGINSGLLSVVHVSVFTKNKGRDYDGYDVKCNYIWDYSLENAKFSFNNQTNNASMNLSPGYYTIWIEKKGNIIQKKDKVEIGNLQEEKESIIFHL
ncbi:hypothetical protein [Algibacter sp. Ld11]|uniref:hypothetical protein n=1 Tax=Algibacter sp. Ld11 TaxID=649150 RepID=UPI003865DD7B